MIGVNIDDHMTSFSLEDDSILEPMEILRYCSSLVTIRTTQTMPIYLTTSRIFGYETKDATWLELAHFSVLQFLKSESAPISFRVSSVPAHTLITRSCLGMLLHFNTPEPEFCESEESSDSEAAMQDDNEIESLLELPSLPNLKDPNSIRKYPFARYAAQYVSMTLKSFLRLLTITISG